MNQKSQKKILKGDIFYARLDETIGSEQGGVRPIIVLQNNVGNKYSPTVIVASITSKVKKKDLPTHVLLGCEFGLNEESMVLVEQIRTIDRFRLKDFIGSVDKNTMERVDAAIIASFGLDCEINNERVNRK